MCCRPSVCWPAALKAMPSRGGSDWVRSPLLAGLAIACIVAIALVPDWEGELHAQGYEEFSSIAAEALRDAELERRDVTNRLEESRGETTARKWGTFLSLQRNTIRRRRSGLENGFDSETPGILAGLDRRLSDALLLGMAAGFKVTDLEFDDVPRSEDFYDKKDPRNPRQLGRQRTYTGTAGPYLSYTPGQAWYLNASLLAGLLAASTERSGDGLNGTARGDTRGYRLSLAGGGGYDWRYHALRVGPHLNVAWDHVHIDGFSESGQDTKRLLRLRHIEDDLVTIKSGGRASYALGFSWGALVPNWRLDFVYRDLDRSGMGKVFLLHPDPSICNTPRCDRFKFL